MFQSSASDIANNKRLTRQVMKLIGQGQTVNQACNTVGYSAARFYYWRDKLNKENTAHAATVDPVVGQTAPTEWTPPRAVIDQYKEEFRALARQTALNELTNEVVKP